MQLATKPKGVFFAMLFVMLASAMVCLYELKHSLDRYDAVVATTYSNQIAFDNIAILFKTQVQEWKDTLLRGKDPRDLDKYWGNFVKREGEVTEKVRALLARLPEGDSQSLLAQFSQEHQKLGASYRQSLELFKVAGFNPAAGDAAVRGADREVERLLEVAGEKIASDRISTSAIYGMEAARAALIGLGAILLASVLCMMLFLFL